MKSLLLAGSLTLFALASTAFGDNYRVDRQHFSPRFDGRIRPQHEIRHGGYRAGTDTVKRWNEIAVNSSGLDHELYGEQLGPCRASRAMAIVHIAMFEAYNAVSRPGYRPYLTLPAANPSASANAAIAKAARDTLAAMFPSQVPTFDVLLTEDLTAVKNAKSRNDGASIGAAAASAILALRAGDNSDHAEPEMGTEYVPDTAPGVWRQDPVSLIPVALGAYWGGVTPFMLVSGDQFRLPPPPDMDSLEYSLAYVKVKRIGGDGVTTPTERTAEETFIGTFWAYDGTPTLCAPPRLYNQIATTIADKKGNKGLELARMLALVNVAMADAGIAAWDSKYFYNFWRPVAGIRESDPGTGPSGLGDGNMDTVGDISYKPLGAPASNTSMGVNFTPPFPAYPSGHACFGGALFETLLRFYGTDNIPFTFVSDEYNGETVDNEGNVRPLKPRSFETLSDAEVENAESRIYLCIHWDFDATSGILQGREVADVVYDRLYSRRR